MPRCAMNESCGTAPGMKNQRRTTNAVLAHHYPAPGMIVQNNYNFEQVYIFLFKFLLQNTPTLTYANLSGSFYS